MDDDDDFLYAGAPTELPAQPPTSAPAAPAPELDDPSSPPEEPAPAPTAEPSAPELSAPAAPDAAMDVENEGNGDDAGSTVDDEEEDDSDDDIEIIIDAPARSLDFRRQAPTPAASSAVRLTQAKPPAPPAPALTTEYTPIQRDAAIPQRPPPPTPALVVPLVSAPLPAAVPVPAPVGGPPAKPDPTLSALQAIQAQLALATQQQQPAETPPQDDVDTSKLPVARAPASHPPLNPDGVLNLDLAALAPDKPWRRPGADISDWFNYGFDEISWEAYVYRRKEVGDLGQLLKEKVVSYAQMEDTQVAALPPEFRQMVIAGTFAPPAPMGVPVGVGVPGGDMHNPFAHGGFAHDDGSGGAGMMMPDFAAMHDPTQQMQPGPGMFPQQQQQQQQQGVPAVAAPTPVPAQPRAPPTGPSRGIPGAPRAPAALLRGGYVSRGGTGRPPPTGPRAASPLPPNVPTGPRAANRYKDRDGIAAASDGLDYGGGGGGGGAAGARGEDERERDRDRDRERDRDRDRERDRDRDRDREHERAGSRKRRAASPEESGRASKRR